MNALKTLFVMALLAAVGYGVYVSITRNPRQAADSGNAPLWPPSPKAPIVGPGAVMPPPSATGAALAPAPGGTIASPPGGLGSTPDRYAIPLTPSTSSMPSPAPGGSAAAALGPPPTMPAGAGLPAARPVSSSPSTTAANESGPPAYPATTYPPPGYPVTGYPPPSYPVTGYPAVANAATGRRVGEADSSATLTSFMQDVQTQLDSGRLDEGLRTLSAWYSSPSVPPAKAAQISELLNQLAGTVIYSRQHLLEPPYVVQAGETLEQIAQKYRVPSALLARINGVRDPQALRPGQQLKVVRGPFNAIVRLDCYELTLVLQDRYAGRFRIGIGRDRQRLDGTYTVRDKVMGATYYAPEGGTIPANDPRNPLGKLYIDLGDQIGIHGTADPQAIGRADNRGYICLADQDIDDLFAILSVGSRVVIER